MNCYLRKPISPSTLSAAIAEATRTEIHTG
jgi:hypothetical protein